ncbi:helix-turn-helix domain-containing protein [Klebsiella aerogenes]|uniref:helix-turn-helix domain-containing protein n=1 Tax=Klebsiella aerogenes TaxID=548 RepID=UPI001E44F9FA|nr:helix-turn-helix domain-containing protein [Klebsiella aerogenes]MCD0204798.1 helix-turn-helix domain-containing protein [Klebsiella aerogenes]
MKINDFFDDEELSSFKIDDRELSRERIIYNTTEDILLLLQDAGLSKSELATRLGKSTPYISQLLDGKRNMTLKTLSDIAYAMDAEAKVVIIKDNKDVSHQVSPSYFKNSYISTSIGSDVFKDKTVKISIKPSFHEVTYDCFSSN